MLAPETEPKLVDYGPIPVLTLAQQFGLKLEPVTPESHHKYLQETWDRIRESYRVMTEQEFKSPKLLPLDPAIIEKIQSLQIAAASAEEFKISSKLPITILKNPWRDLKVGEPEPSLVETHIKDIVARNLRIEKASAALEGRKLIALANQIVHRELASLPKVPDLLKRVTRLLQFCADEEKIKLSPDRLRFGLQIPPGIDVTKLPVVDDQIVDEIWSQLGRQLQLSTKFSSCVNTIINSSSTWKLDSDREPKAIMLVIKLIDSERL